MNTPNKEAVESELRNRQAAEARLASLRLMDDENSKVRKELEERGDLTNADVVTQLVRVQALAVAIPRQREVCAQELLKSESLILKAVHGFIQVDVSPRNRSLSARAREGLRQQLAPNFSDPKKLEAAVENSDLIGSLTATPAITATPSAGVERYASEVLEHWARLDLVEAKLS